MSDFIPCVIIPCYNHSQFLPSVLDKIQGYKLPIIIVNDGSEMIQTDLLKSIASDYKCYVYHHVVNKGKGAAVKTALKLAKDKGYTHALQIDADGQHDINDIPLFLNQGQKNLSTLWSAQPIYDNSIPNIRKYGRYFTHIWVWLETLSLELKDSLCGFRLYPVDNTLQLLESRYIGSRMDFDIEILVHYFWRYRNVSFIPSKVIYPKEGISHFHWQENLFLSKMHVRLLLQMWRNMPIFRNKNTVIHWSSMREIGSHLGIRFLLGVYSLLGRTGFKLFLKPVIIYYYFFAREYRYYSRQYLNKLKNYCHLNNLYLDKKIKLTEFNHMTFFAESVLEKILAWKGDINASQLHFKGSSGIKEEDLKGSLVIGSHLGNLELSRALGVRYSNLKILAVVFTEHAVQFNQILAEYQSNISTILELIHVAEISPATLFLLQEKIQQGYMLVIVGDRTSPSDKTNSNNQSAVNFLGDMAFFAHGPYILAYLLKVPVYTLFLLKNSEHHDQFDVYLDRFADKIELPRYNRDASIIPYIEEYRNRLEYYCLLSPLEWYNFFDFWHKG